jgi:hypothetical protein
MDENASGGDAEAAFRRRNDVTTTRLILPTMTPDNTAMIPAPLMPLRRLACQRCGGAFECGTGGADGACWCMAESTRLPMPETAAADCLCPACLSEALAEQAARPTA